MIVFSLYVYIAQKFRRNFKYTKNM